MKRLILLIVAGLSCCFGVQGAVDFEKPRTILVLHGENFFYPAGLLQDRAMVETVNAGNARQVQLHHPGLWQKYHWAIVGLSVFGLAQSALITSLLVQRRRRRRSEEALRKSEERNRAIIAAIPDMMFLLNRDGVFVDYHIADPKNLLVSPDQFLGRTIRDVMPTEVGEKFTRCFDAVLRSGEGQMVECSLFLNGKDRFFEAHIVRSGADQLLSVVRDITERKRAEEGLRNIAAGVSAKTGGTFFRSLAEYISRVLEVEYAYVCEVYDGGHRARTLASYAHGAEVENMDYPLEGAPCEQVLKLGVAAFPRGVKGEFPDDVMLQGMEVEGYLGVCLRNTTGQPQGLMAVMSRNPMTNVENAKAILSIFAARASAELERKQAEDCLRLKEQDLRSSEERYREVVETQTDLVCRFLPDTTLTFVNEAYCRFFGKPRQELIGLRFVELIPEAAREAALKHVNSLIKEPRKQTIEHEVLMPDGSIGWQQWVDYAVPSSDGQVREFQAIGRDITDRKRAEEARQNLAHVSRLAVVGELTAMIAHEINQPLGAIQSNVETAELLLDTGVIPRDEIREILIAIREDNLRASETLRRIYRLVKKHEMSIQTLHANEFVSDALHLAGSDALRRRVQIHRNLSTSLPAIKGDNVHLQQVLLNLILNALDAMKDTPEHKRRLLISTSNGNGFVTISVTDTGPGVPPENLSRVFDSFFTNKPDGMGLGLSIARSIIQAHRGRIWAENNQDAPGATFHFAVPVADT